MKSVHDMFSDNGYIILDGLLTDSEIDAIETQISKIPLAGAGTRNLLHGVWCRDLAERLKHDRNLAEIFPSDPVAVQCTYFEKSDGGNWLVTLHRDLSIPVKQRVQSEGWSGWSKKEGQLFAQPPKTILKSLVVVRIHLEDNTEMNSPLKVVVGSHAGSGQEDERISCYVRRGGALVMSPFLLHASSKLQEGKRRVLHFLYGPRILPNQAEWAHVV